MNYYLIKIMGTQGINITFPIPQPDLTETRATTVTHVAGTDTDGNLTITVTVSTDLANVAAVRQADTLTIDDTVDGDAYVLDFIAGSEDQPPAVWVASATDTVEDIATGLASVVQLVSDRVSASVSAGVITLTANIPGEAITYDVSRSTTAANLTLANTTTASGTATMGEIGTYTLTVVGGDNLQFKREVAWKDGQGGTSQTLSAQTVSHRTKMVDLYKAVNP